MIERSVSRWVWQLPNSRGHNVASANRWNRPRAPALATCSRYRSSPPGRSSEYSCRSTLSGSRTEHNTSEHTTASNGSPPLKSSAVSPVTTTGTGATSAAARAWAASRGSGSIATTCSTGLRVVREVRPGARADFEHPARQAGQVLPAKRPHRLGFVGGDDGPDPREERVVDTVAVR